MNPVLQHIARYDPLIQDLLNSNVSPDLLYEAIKKDSVPSWQDLWYYCQGYNIPYEFAIKRFVNEISGIQHSFTVQHVYMFISCWHRRQINNLEFKKILKREIDYIELFKSRNIPSTVDYK